MAINEKKRDIPYANASPSKYFFCHMLTRDIELKDAIMDLMDNCVDGAMRQKGNPPSIEDDSYYKGYRIDIELTNNKFTIKDNCGGIPKKIAEEYAFRFGRPENLPEENRLPTIGLYGIGMKRAIFKIGTDAVVHTKTIDDGEYSVAIPCDWIQTDTWSFSMTNGEGNVHHETGTTIIVNLKNNISEFSKEKLPDFIQSLMKDVASNFGLIIHKGLEITINKKLIKGVDISFVVDEHPVKDRKRYLPYIYSAIVDGVDVFMVLGFYRREILPSEDDIDEELKGGGRQRTSEKAGWTIVCNDRIVLYNNKDHLTGWGEFGIPKYHTQFIGIKGIVYFNSSNPSLLPTTTSKRGIDLNSELYASVKKRMCMALKNFIDYTNKWKGKEDEEKRQSSKSKLMDVRDLIKNKNNFERFLDVKLKNVSRPNEKERDAVIFIPDLPLPKENVVSKRISFLVEVEEYDDVAEYLFDDDAESTKPAEVGKKCFNMILNMARKQ